MENIPGAVVESLKHLGLSNYEARIYAALVLYDAAEAKELIDFLAISKPSVYEGLERLEELGLAVKRNSKPAMYTPVRPEIAVRILMEGHTKAAGVASRELAMLEQEKVKRDRADIVWTIYGDANIESKIRSLIRNAGTCIGCVTADRYLPLFNGADLRDVSLRLIVISNQPALEEQLKERLPGNDHHIAVISPKKFLDHALLPPPPDSHVPDFMKLDNIVELIVDEHELLLIPPLPFTFVTGLNTINHEMILHSQDIIDRLWGRLIQGGLPDSGDGPPVRKQSRKSRSAPEKSTGKAAKKQ